MKTALIICTALAITMAPALGNDYYNPYNQQQRNQTNIQDYQEAYRQGYQDYYRNQNMAPPAPPAPPAPQAGQGNARGGYIQGIRDAQREELRRNRPIPQ